jgi:hypothetical protein
LLIRPNERLKLVNLIRKFLPNAEGALLVGSAVHRPGQLVADLDLIAIVPDGVGEKTQLGRHLKRQVECSIYDPSFPTAISSTEPEFLLMLREVYRIGRGVPLFGEGIDEWRAPLFRLPPPARQIEQIINASTCPRSWNLQTSKGCFLELWQAVEAIIFCSGCMFGPEGPSKPKWYLHDAEHFYPEPVMHCLQTILAQSPDIDIFSCEFLAIDVANWHPILRTLRRDTLLLHDANMHQAAKLTFYTLASRVAKRGEFLNGMSDESLRFFNHVLLVQGKIFANGINQQIIGALSNARATLAAHLSRWEALF